MALGFASALSAGATEIARGVVVVGYDDTAVAAGLARTRGEVSKGGAVLGRLALGLGVVGAVAGKMAIDFEEKMDRIVALVGVSRQQVRDWQEDIIKLAPVVGKSTGELADALYFIASAGYRGQAAIDILTESAKASAAGLGATKVVADAVTSAINAYGADVLTAAHATDILIATVTAGKMPPEDLARSLGRVLPIAAKMGVSFDQVGAAIASMSRQGINARFSVFGLMALIQTFAKPTSKTRDELDRLHLSIDDVRRSIRERGLFATMMMLKAAVNDNIDAWGRLLPNQRAENVALILTGKAAKQNAAIFDQVTDSAGKTNKAFSEIERSTKQKLREGFQSLMVILIRLGELLLPSILAVVKVISLLFTVLGRSEFAVHALAFGIKALVAAFIIYKTVALASAAATKLYELWVLRSLYAQRLLSGALYGSAVAARVSSASVVGGAVRGTAAVNAETAAVGRLRASLLGLAGRVFISYLIVQEIVKHIPGVPRGMGHDFSDPTAHDVHEKGNPYVKGSSNYLAYRAGRKGVMPDSNGRVHIGAGITVPSSDPAYQRGLADRRKAGLAGEGGARPDDRSGTRGPQPRSRDRNRDRNKPPKHTPETPLWIQQEEADAARTRTDRDDRKALEDEKKWLQRQLKRRNLTRRQRIELTRQLASVEQQIRSIDDAEARRQKEAAARRRRDREARERAAKERAREKAREKAREHQRSLETPDWIELEKAKARRTKTTKDDMKALEDEKKWLEQEIKRKDLTKKELAQLYNQLADVEKQIADIRKNAAKKKADITRAELAAYVALRGSFFARFAPNIFHENAQGQLEFGSTPLDQMNRGGGDVTVNQHFHHKPESQFVAMNRARYAAHAAMDG